MIRALQRNIIAGKPAPGGTLLGAGGLAVVYLLAACWFFNRMFKHAVRTGLIARYSAETIS